MLEEELVCLVNRGSNSIGSAVAARVWGHSGAAGVSFRARVGTKVAGTGAPLGKVAHQNRG